LSFCDRERALRSAGLVTRHAALAMAVQTCSARWISVRIVTGDAAQFAAAGAVATAGHHLFHLRHGLVLVLHFRRPHEDRPEKTQRQTGTVIKRFRAAPLDPQSAQQVALLTDRLA